MWFTQWCTEFLYHARVWLVISKQQMWECHKIIEHWLKSVFKFAHIHTHSCDIIQSFAEFQMNWSTKQVVNLRSFDFKSYFMVLDTLTPSTPSTDHYHVQFRGMNELIFVRRHMFSSMCVNCIWFTMSLSFDDRSSVYNTGLIASQNWIGHFLPVSLLSLFLSFSPPVNKQHGIKKNN